MIPPQSHEIHALSSKQGFAQSQQQMPFYGGRRISLPTSPSNGSPPRMMGMGASDEELMRMEQEVEASHMAARLTLARMRAARQMQMNQEQHYQQRSMVINSVQQQRQPRIVSPVKQQNQQQQHARRLLQNDSAARGAAPSLPGLDLLHTASLAVASETTSGHPSPSPGTVARIPEAAALNAIAIQRAAGGPPLIPTSTDLSRRVSSSSATGDASDSDSSDGRADCAPGLRMYIDEVRPTDILCGRGGRSNHHPGNKRYRQIVGNIKFAYQHCPAKTLKTDLSRAIVENCYSGGARFIKQDSKDGRFYVLSKAEARKKTSQALRETKALKWTC